MLSMTISAMWRSKPFRIKVRSEKNVLVTKKQKKDFRELFGTVGA